MTANEEKACLELERTCELRDEREIDLYVDAASRLRGGTDIDLLRRMLLCLRDTDAGEVQYELVEACESFPSETYVDVFVEEASRIASHSTEWFELMFQSILNGDELRRTAIGKIKSLDLEHRQFFINLVGKIARHTPKYQSVLAELR